LLDPTVFDKYQAVKNYYTRALPVSICPSSPSSSIRAAPTASSQLASHTHAASLGPTITILSGQQYLTTEASWVFGATKASGASWPQDSRSLEPLVLLSRFIS
jgi:hypothetical protein